MFRFTQHDSEIDEMFVSLNMTGRLVVRCFASLNMTDDRGKLVGCFVLLNMTDDKKG